MYQNALKFYEGFEFFKIFYFSMGKFYEQIQKVNFPKLCLLFKEKKFKEKK